MDSLTVIILFLSGYSWTNMKFHYKSSMYLLLGLERNSKNHVNNFCLETVTIAAYLEILQEVVLLDLENNPNYKNQLCSSMMELIVLHFGTEVGDF